ncbi:hypothetical protein KRX56_06270 [Dermabacteraceae bacterium TAE3-ERU27]|nr:hypothetical protein [Dermabacteraceae bacterium TAE3-ERU27]
MKQTQATQEEQKPAAKNDSATPEGVEATAPGTYEALSEDGAVVTLELPSTENFPEVSKLLSDMHAGEEGDYSYVLADVDNRQGTKYVNMFLVLVTDPEGHEYQYRTVQNSLEDLEALPKEVSDGKYALNDGTEISKEEYYRLSDAMHKHATGPLSEGVNPHARRKLLLVGPKLPKKFTSVQVYPSGIFELVFATPKQP